MKLLNRDGAFSPRVHAAAEDYRWLLDRGYPDQPSLKLVGDRHRLSRVERGMLYRGVFSARDSRRRRERLRDRGAVGEISSPPEVMVDGHNVLFTVWNYLSGRPMVTATDGLVRDIGGTRSRLPGDERFGRLAELLCAAISSCCLFAGVTVLLDEPLPWSRDQAVMLQETWHRVVAPSSNGAAIGDEIQEAASVETEPRNAVFTVLLERSVDARVAAVGTGWIATSDTGIIDRSVAPVFDLAGYIIATFFRTIPESVLAERRESTE